MKINDEERYENIFRIIKRLLEEIHGPSDVEKALYDSRTNRHRSCIRQSAWYILVYREAVPMDFIEKKFNKRRATIIFGIRTMRNYMKVKDNIAFEYLVPLEMLYEKHMAHFPSSSRYMKIIDRWKAISTITELEQFTETMEKKANNINELISETTKEGYKITRKPDTVYVPFGTEEKDLSFNVRALRNKHGFMIQTEII